MKIKEAVRRIKRMRERHERDKGREKCSIVKEEEEEGEEMEDKI